jgi:hypothetical protein
MTKTNDPPLAIGEIIDRIEQIREQLFMLQRTMEKMEFAESAASAAGAANGNKDV